MLTGAGGNWSLPARLPVLLKSRALEAKTALARVQGRLSEVSPRHDTTSKTMNVSATGRPRRHGRKPRAWPSRAPQGVRRGSIMLGFEPIPAPPPYDRMARFNGGALKAVRLQLRGPQFHAGVAQWRRTSRLRTLKACLPKQICQFSQELAVSA